MDSVKTNFRVDCCPTLKNMELDFEEVETGATKIMSVKIVNQSNYRQSYILQQDPTSNSLDTVFYALEYSWSLEPCECYVCDISFRPSVPNRNYTEYFLILDTHNCCHRLTVRGYCTGPKVTSCVSRLVMVGGDNCRALKCFKLTNSSNVTAKFMFDIDNEQGPFKVNEKSGFIRENSSKNISVSFEPSGDGIYKYYLNCLILHQDPIIIELYGISGIEKCQDDIENFLFKIEELKELDRADSFKSFMRDVTTAVKSDPPTMSLSNNFINFGHAEIGCENFTKRTPQTISITNHNKFDILLTWDKDVSEVFQIRPQEAKMKKNRTSLFEVRFDPTESETFYSRELIARVFRLPCCAENFKNPKTLLMNFIPHFVSLRLIGHTYKRDMNNWIPQYEVQETVVMPACVPAMPTYTTFAIKNFGSQPLMFCFVPPGVSHFNVKPMMGLINPVQEYQLIAVQLFPEAENNRAYVERWAILLNGSPQNEIFVDFHAYAEQACLVFGDANHITLDPVYVGCQLSQLVPVRNNTRHTVRYSYQAKCFPCEFSVKKLEGSIKPNETVMHEYMLKSNEIKDFEFEVPCCINAEVGGKTCLVKPEVSAKSTVGSLMAVPENINIGICEFNKSKKLDFKIYNFSQVLIHYLLCCRPTKSLEMLKNPERDVKLTPLRGSLAPGKSEKVVVIIHPSQPGFYELTIDYYIRPNAGVNAAKPDVAPRNLCTLSCDCFLPTIQIKDLQYIAETNKQVSKLSLWKSLKIDTLNSAAQNLLPMDETEIEMIVPFTNMCEGEKFIIKLLVKNSLLYDSTWIFKKKKTCLCKKGENKAITKKTKECLFCVHDDACDIRPKDISLKTNETGVLTIEINGNTLESSGICWKLDIGFKRTIFLNIRLRYSIILSGSLLKFNTDYIGHYNDMRYQAIWLYNNTEFESSYEVDLKNFATLNKENFWIIFTCMNPKGSIEGFTRKPVFFGFYPNKFGKFETTIKVRLDDMESTLKVEAEAVCTPLHNEIEHESCPLNSTFLCPKVIANFSKDCLIVPPLTTHGKTSEFLMLHNHHLHNVLYFEWQNYELPGVVKITVVPERGLIQPHTLLTLLVFIETSFLECSLDVDLFCDFLDVSHRSKLERNYRKLEDAYERIKNEFTITENGTSFPEQPPIDKSEKPPTINKTLTLKLNICNSKNADLKLEPLENFKKVPSDEIKQKTKFSQTDFNSELMKISSDIFEGLIWDIVRSKVFSETLKDTVSGPHHLKYSQLVMNGYERERITERSKILPPKRHVEDLLHSMISSVLHEEFSLGIIHMGLPKDIRQHSYRKMQIDRLQRSYQGHIQLL